MEMALSMVLLTKLSMIDCLSPSVNASISVDHESQLLQVRTSLVLRVRCPRCLADSIIVIQASSDLFLGLYSTKSVEVIPTSYQPYWLSASRRPNYRYGKKSMGYSRLIHAKCLLHALFPSSLQMRLRS